MVNEMELYLMAFLEGYLGPEKAYKLRNKAYTWRFKDAWRYGMMHRLAKRDLEEGFTYAEVDAIEEVWDRELTYQKGRIVELERSVYDLEKNERKLECDVLHLESLLKCECQKNELAKKYIETLIHPV